MKASASAPCPTLCSAVRVKTASRQGPAYRTFELQRSQKAVVSSSFRWLS